MHDVQRRPGDRRVRDDLLERSERAAAGERGRRAEVDERRRVVPGCEAEELQQLAVARAGRVADAVPETDAPVAQPLLHEPLQVVALLVRRRAVQRIVGAVAEREGAVGVAQRKGAAHGADAGALVADRRTVVEAGGAVPASVPAADRERADLELERRRYAVHRLVAAADRILAVRVEVDEAGGDDETARRDDLRPDEVALGDGGDPAVPDPDVADAVQTALRIEHPAAREHEIERLRGRRRRSRRIGVAGGQADDGECRRGGTDDHGHGSGRPRRSPDSARRGSGCRRNSLGGHAIGHRGRPHPAAPAPAIRVPAEPHQSPRIFHHSTPTGIQMSRLSTEAMKPVRHQSRKLT